MTDLRTIQGGMDGEQATNEGGTADHLRTTAKNGLPLLTDEQEVEAVSLVRDLAQRLFNGKFIGLPEALQLQHVADLAEAALNRRAL